MSSPRYCGLQVGRQEYTHKSADAVDMKYFQRRSMTYVLGCVLYLEWPHKPVIIPSYLYYYNLGEMYNSTACTNRSGISGKK